mgnify:CR=1 FL=1
MRPRPGGIAALTPRMSDRRLIGDLEHQLRHRLAFERQPSGQQLVQAHGEREQVRAALRCVLPASCSGDMNEGVPSTIPVFVFDESVSRAMPKSVTFSVIGLRVVHEVRRLDVAVHDALLVRVAAAPRRARDDRNHLRRRQQAARLRIAAPGRRPSAAPSRCSTGRALRPRRRS